MSSPATIRAADLGLLLAAAKLRRYTKGRTCQLCALSEGPVIEVDCARTSRWTRPDMLAAARRSGISPARVMPLTRGFIYRVFERTNREHGRREVLRTWGVGIRALNSEPRWTLNGGEAAA